MFSAISAAPAAGQALSPATGTMPAAPSLMVTSSTSEHDITSCAPGLELAAGMPGRHIGYPGIEPQPGDGTLAGRPDAAHRKAKATGENKVALILSFQQLNEYQPLARRQRHDGAVETVALVAERGLGARITFRGPAVNQPYQLQLAEQDLPPSLGGQPDALPAADGRQPAVEPVRIGELVNVFQAAQPRELEGIFGVFGR